MSTDEMTMDDVAQHLARAVWPEADDPAGESEIVATVDNVGLTQRQLDSLSRAFTMGYMMLDPCFNVHVSESALSLYSAAMNERDRPWVLVMPKWGECRTVLVFSWNRKAIELSAQAARKAGADIIVDAQGLGVMCAVSENERAEIVAQAICEG